MAKIARVQLEDGRVARFEVPDNFTPQQVEGLARSIKSTPQPKAKPNVTSALEQGFTFGLSDEIAGAANVVANAIAAPFSSKIDFAPRKAYVQGRDHERAVIAETRKNAPWASSLSELVGGLASTPASATVKGASSLAGAIKSAAKTGAALGAVSGFGYGEGASGSVSGAGLGALVGGGVGAAIPAVAAPVTKAVRAAKDFVSPRNGLGRELVVRAMQDDALTPAMVGQAMDEARARGVPVMLADQGENLRGLAGAVSRKPGASRRLVRAAVNARQTGQGERIRGAIERDLGQIPNYPAEVGAAQSAARAQAASGVSSAEQSLLSAIDSVGPRTDRLATGSAARDAFTQAYQAAKQRSHAAYTVPELQQAHPVNIPQEFFSQDLRKAADAFYGDGGGVMPSALREILDDAAAQSTTTRTLTNIDRRLADFAGEARMKGARSDAAFAERVRKDLSAVAERQAPADYRAALANAKSVRAEQGRLFETRDLPRAFAVDQYGNPKVGDTAIPERILRPGAIGGDTADSLIGAVGQQRAEGLVREELRRLAGEGKAPNALLGQYREALNRFPALAQSLQEANRRVSDLATANTRLLSAGAPGSTAVEQGYAAINHSADEIERAIQGMNPAQRGQYATGFRAALANAMDRKVDGADKVAVLLGTPQKRAALAKVFGGEVGLNRLVSTLADERAANETYRVVSTGSPTARNLADDGNVTDEALLEDLTGKALKGALNGGGLTGAAAELINAFKDISRFGAGKTGQRAREEAAALLSEIDPQLLRQAMRDSMRKQAARRVGERGTRKAVIRSGAVAGRIGGAVAGASAKPADPVE